MLRLALAVLFLSACSTVKTGGDGVYTYNIEHDYSPEELSQLASGVVVTSKRDPHVGTLDKLFAKGQAPLKKVGIVIFESIIQPTRGGLASEDKIFLSEAGKQIMTEKLLSVWEESFPILAPEITYLPTIEFKKAKTPLKHGHEVEDYVKSPREELAPDDIFFTKTGAKTTLTTLVYPRDMRNLSMALVPANELMGGPKWSEHHKHFLNEIVKELKLDAVIIVMSELSWTTARKEKHSGENIAEELTVKIKASTLIPFSKYHERLAKIGEREMPKINLAYRSYEATLKSPIDITLPSEEENFDKIQSQLLSPLLKVYKDLAQLVILKQTADLKATHWP